MKLVVSGGGTGGHFFPALEVLKRASDKKLQTLYTGTRRGIEESYLNLVPGKAYLFEVFPFKGVSTRERLKALASFLRASLKLSGEISSSDRVLLLGGYGSVPAGITAVIKRAGLYIHEQNSIPSATNRLFAPFSRKVFITFEYTRKFFKGKEVIRTGTPVRRELIKERMQMDKAKERLGFKPEEPLILFMGGSQGAVFINKLCMEMAKKTDYQILLLAGRKNYEVLKEESESFKRLKVIPFSERMGLVYSATDVCVSRAGASTISELSLFGVPAVFIPFPYASDNHQYHNAKEIEELGGAYLIEQKEASLPAVLKLVEKALASRENMSDAIRKFTVENSADLILDELLKD